MFLRAEKKKKREKFSPRDDPMIKSEVLVMSVVLFFLDDSTMHTKVTSTPYPGASNYPCQVCKLGFIKREDKANLKYVQAFFGIKKVYDLANRKRQTLSNIRKLKWKIGNMR
ncbi:hypothetical protein VP01_13298g1 [Puccinia sorghi]|uniref:Uncharacterized protein n=1 Tax=Puccinia sorghi TaxID=27349 RepID=A0A0L6VMQ2_9BASI|nr:hypothetical protein VP01_13298g1 [Puccinia sorghi]